ncbi:MAG: hypothetical protein K2J80_02365 [Oscillospiraceae bacterium]|nr:hypothetical protein [Oscillospiraceae bacterium]
MRTVEECYEYVLKRCDELAAQRRRKRELALKAAAPVCGIAVIAGTAAAMHNGKANTEKYVSSAGNSVISSELDNSGAFSAQETVNSVAESTPKHENKLNIGEVEIAEGGEYYLPMIPPLYEMTRDEVLEHFGLSTELDLSGVVEGLCETAPRNGVLNINGKHGFHRGYTIDENGVGRWEELNRMFEHDEFVFKSEDGTKTATVIFDHDERVNWLRSGIMCSVGDGRYSTEPFYALPKSEIAGVEMRIAKRSIGGYYAEFNTGTLAVGLIAEGLSEEETVNILEYLAEYVSSANPNAGNSVSVDEIEMSYPELIF